MFVLQILIHNPEMRRRIDSRCVTDSFYFFSTNKGLPMQNDKPRHGSKQKSKWITYFNFHKLEFDSQLKS